MIEVFLATKDFSLVVVLKSFFNVLTKSLVLILSSAEGNWLKET